MLTPTQTNDLIRFWLNQDREHALFYALGFQDAQLRAEAMRLHDDYARALAADDLAAGMVVLERAQAFKLAALARLKTGEWLGWIWPTFLQHTFDELEMMRAKISRPVLPRAELCAIDRFNLEHLAFAAHLFDPSEKALQAATTEAAAPALATANRCAADTYATLRDLSLRSGAAIDRLFTDVTSRTPPPASIIHPALGAHVVREGRHWLDTMRSLPPISA